MTYTLTDTQISRFRRKIGDSVEAFSPDLLNDLYDEAEGNLDKAILLAYEELLSNAILFTDYTQNETSEKRSQIFTNLMKLRDLWAEKVDKATRATKQVRIVGTQIMPPDNKAHPDTYGRSDDGEF